MDQPALWKRQALLGLILFATAVVGVAYVLLSNGDHASREAAVGDRSVRGGTLANRTGESAEAEGGTRTDHRSREPSRPPLLRGVVSGRAATGEEAPIAGASVYLLPSSFVEGMLTDFFETPESATGDGASDFERAARRARGRIEAARRSAPTAKTDESGVVEFRGIEPRAYLVLTVADGWIFRYGDAVVLEAGETRELNQTLDRGSSISGRAIDGRGDGVGGIPVEAGARAVRSAAVGLPSAGLVEFMNGTALRGPFTSTTAADGTFAISSLPPGAYDLEAHAPSGLRVDVTDVATGRSDVLILIGEPSSVEGAIVDSDGAPLDGVALELEVEREPANPLLMGLGAFDDTMNRALGDGPRRTATDSGGHFRIGSLGPGRYVLTLAQKGVRRMEQRFSLDWGENLSLGVLQVDPGARVRGRVLSESGEAIQGARVTVTPSQVGLFQRHAAIADLISGRSRAESGPDGAFELGGLQPGQYRLRVDAVGWAPAGLNVETTDGPCEIRLVPGERVTGRVTDARTGAPTRARVRAGEVETTAGADGRFVLDGVVFIDPADPASVDPLQRIVGLVPLVARAPGEAIQRMVTLTVTADGYATAEHRLDLDQRATDVHVRLQRAPEITGRVLSPEGDPVPGSLVRVIWGERFPPNLIDPSLLVLRVVVSDAEGRYSLRDLREIAPRQRYRLLADHPDYARGVSASFSLDGLDGEPKMEVDLALSRPAVVRGVVSDGTWPVAGAEVRLAGIDKGERNAPSDVMMRMLGLPRGGVVAYTDSGGRFIYRRVAPGDYVINAGVAGLGSADERELHVEAEGDVEVDILIDPGEEIAGQVLDRTGNSLEGATIELRREPEAVGAHDPDRNGQKTVRELQRLLGGAFRTVRTDEEGAFTIRGVPAGRYTARALLSGYASAEAVGVTAGETDLELVLSTGAALVGRVVDAASGAAVTNFSLFVLRAGREEIDYLQHVAGGGPGPDESDPEGRFERNDLVPGEVQVLVKADGYLPATISVVLIEGRAVEQNFALERAASVRGRVVDASTGRPILGAYVRLKKDSLPGGDGASDGARSSTSRDGVSRDGGKRSLRDLWPGDTTRTDDNGRFLLESAPPGPVTLAVEHNEYLPETRELPDVRAGAEPEVVIRLARGLTLEGRVVTESGGAVASKFMFLNGVSPETRGARKSAVTSTTGVFRFTGLRPGRYRLVLPEGAAAGGAEIELRESVHDHVLRVK